MTTLSITFHCTETILENWKNYIDTEFLTMIENLMDVEKYIFSEVDTEMIQEGKNFNLLLLFDDEDIRNIFMKNEFVNISERVETKFGNEVMIFPTFLHPIQHRLD